MAHGSIVKSVGMHAATRAPSGQLRHGSMPRTARGSGPISVMAEPRRDRRRPGTRDGQGVPGQGAKANQSDGEARAVFSRHRFPHGCMDARCPALARFRGYQASFIYLSICQGRTQRRQ